ncbi:MAG: site-2 protease family protein [Planctomycetota bacterium]
MTGWWVTDAWNASPALLVSWVFWVIVSITLHELAHGWAALRQGDDTPLATGHMTWNPVVHMGTFSLIIFAVVGIAWGAMPVNPSRFRSRYGDAIVAAAGPAMNLLLAVCCIVLGGVWAWATPRLGLPSNFEDNLQQFFFAGAGLNLVLCAFNLFPAPPLDGSRILANFYRPYRAVFTTENGMWFGLGLFLLLWFVFSDRIFAFGFGTAAFSIAAISGLLP